MPTSQIMSRRHYDVTNSHLNKEDIKMNLFLLLQRNVENQSHP